MSGILGNYWDGNNFVIPGGILGNQSQQFHAGLAPVGDAVGPTGGTPGTQAPTGGTPAYPAGPSTSIISPQISQSQMGGTPATGGAFGAGTGFLSGLNPAPMVRRYDYDGPYGDAGTAYQVNPVSRGLPPGLLGPTFNNLLDQEIAAILRSVER